MLGPTSEGLESLSAQESTIGTLGLASGIAISRLISTEFVIGEQPRSLRFKELALLRVERLGEEILRRNMLWFHLPIVDVSIPDERFEKE